MKPDHEGDIPSPVPYSNSYNQVTGFSSLSRQEDYTRVWISAVEMIEGHV